jgi:hypothetical protein
MKNYLKKCLAIQNKEFAIASTFLRGKYKMSYGSGIYNYLCKSVPITTDVSSNLDQGKVYNIMW